MKKISKKAAKKRKIPKYVYIIAISVVVLVALGISGLKLYNSMERRSLEASNIGSLDGQSLFGYEAIYFKELGKKRIVEENPKLAEEAGDSFWSSDINGKKASQHLREYIEKDLLEYAVMKKLAQNEGITLDPKEEILIKNDIKENERRLKAKKDERLLWGEEVFFSISRDNLFKVTANINVAESYRKKLMDDINVTDEAIKVEYEMIKDSSYSIPERFRATKISFLFDQNNPEVIPEKAKECRERVLKGEKLKDIFNEYVTLDSEKESKGVEYFFRNPNDQNENIKKLSLLKKGEVSEALRFQRYYIVYQIDEIIAPTYRGLDDKEVYESVSDNIKRKKMDSLLTEEMSKTQIKWVDELMKKIVDKL